MQVVSILRLAFVPLFILNVHNPDVHVFSDLFCVIMVACYAITNGLFASVAMMKGPSAVRGLKCTPQLSHLPDSESWCEFLHTHARRRPQ